MGAPSARVDEFAADPKQRYRAAAARMVPGVSFWIAALYVLLAVAHPVLIGGRIGWTMSIVAAASAVVLGIVAWYSRQPRFPVEQAELYLAAIILILTMNSVLHLVLTQESWQTSNLMLVLIGAGISLLSRGWNWPLSGLIWLAWLGGMWQIPDANLPHWVLAMGMATLLGQLVRVSRRNSLAAAAAFVVDEKAARQQAEALAESRQQLLSTISHDVRTPITGIVGMVELLREQPLDARTRELVTGVQYSAEGLTTFLGNLLDLARVEAGRLEVEAKGVAVAELIEEVLQMVGPIAQAKQLPLIGACQLTAPSTVKSDRARLQQILLNLVSNAVKFTDSGCVTVIARADEQGWLAIDVTDTGAGVAPDQLGRLFDTFYQADATATGGKSGSGLGLAIAQRLAQALGGEISVRSALGVGSVFSVRLPIGMRSRPAAPEPGLPSAVVSGHPNAVLAVSTALRKVGVEVLAECDGRPGAIHFRVVADTRDPESTRTPQDGHRLVVLAPVTTAQAAPVAGELVPLPWTQDRLRSVLGGTAKPAKASAPASKLRGGTRILLAEDDNTNRSLMAEMLRQLGATVTAVGDGAAAVEEVARDEFDVVLLDLNMPVLGGVDAARIIRDRLAGEQDLPLVALTADPGWADRAVLAAAGLNGYIPKPVTMEGLARGIVAVLRAGETVPEAVATKAAATLDLATLDQLATDLGDVDFVCATVRTYLEELPERIVAIHRAASAGDTDGVRDTAHQLKGASALVGAQNMADRCAELELQPTSQDLVDSVLGESEALESALAEYLQMDHSGR